MKKRVKIVLLLLSTSGYAWGCTLSGPSAQLSVIIPPLTVQRDLPIGTVIWQQTVNAPLLELAGECGDESETRANLVGNDSGILSGRNPVYNTGVPGIGYAVATGPEFSDGWPAAKDKTASVNTLSLRLVVTGTVSSGVLDAGEYARRLIDGQTAQQLMVQTSVPLTRLACELNDSRDRVVPLGAVLRTGFTGPGSTQGEQVFQLGLTCDAGTQVNIQFDGEADNSGTPGVLALLNHGESGIASGIGVQLLYHQTPIALGERLPLETAPAGVRTYPFTARYYQTQPKVTSGDANAVATFNLTYQ
ncbi:hypothetical protein Z042_10590 [Chania multitudinisentens RB-25]|uniref:Uncharacterized protein n=1 Tax=Chania multitudinisentens RB-25 TaxID=1441930 RepID=W0LK80_9GAMM|nr:fimbrial protein [Chania multitudinisentens]AHG22742.1 hypothetical protein Z042_10590 [Chania multitudinisentens RB-25]